MNTTKTRHISVLDELDQTSGWWFFSYAGAAIGCVAAAGYFLLTYHGAAPTHYDMLVVFLVIGAGFALGLMLTYLGALLTRWAHRTPTTKTPQATLTDWIPDANHPCPVCGGTDSHGLMTFNTETGWRYQTVCPIAANEVVTA